MIRTAQSACEVPVIMFLMKSRCPGASMTVQLYLGVSNFHRAMSMVIPRSRSAFSLSSTCDDNSVVRSSRLRPGRLADKTMLFPAVDGTMMCPKSNNCAHGRGNEAKLTRSCKCEPNEVDRQYVVRHHKRLPIHHRQQAKLDLKLTQAYLKDLLFISAASFSNFSMTRLSIPPSL